MPSHDGNNQAVIIGSGFGGLAAAVRLAARGYRVTVLERMEKPGGKAYVLEQDGFIFDAGPTVVTAPHLFSELWSLAGKRMEQAIDLRPVKPLYEVIFQDKSRFRYSDDHQCMLEEVARFSPRDVGNYEKFTAYSERVFRLGFEGLVDQPFLSWKTMARILPDMIGLRSYRTVYKTVAAFIRDEKIRQVLTFHTLLVGGNPFTTTSIYCLISRVEQKWGVFFPMGGTGALVRGLVDLIESMDGTVRCNAEVETITLKQRRATGVRLKSGEEIRADVVVSNADAAWTYRHLVPRNTRKHWTDKKIDRQKFAMSCFLWYFGTRRTYPEIAHHTILLSKRYRELLQDIFKRKILADDFSLYLHRPTATDPTLAPAGCDAFYVLSPVPNLEPAPGSKQSIDWREQSEPYRKAVADYLSEQALKGFQKEVITSASMTPHGFLEKTNAYRGAAFGLQPLLTQSAYFRPHNKSEDIEGLFLVGASTHPGAGLPGVVASARVLDRLIPPAAEPNLHMPSPHVFLYRLDLAACRQQLKHGSKSFFAASLLLPQRIRAAATALYAFCRQADDAVDQKRSDPASIDSLYQRLDRIYRNHPEDNPVDRAFCRIVHTFNLPREVLMAMIEGFCWDVDGRRYESLDELEQYCARVASSVGVLMTLLMGERRPGVLARACDLGLAMQLTNICRDVGQDARNARLYLPLSWLHEAEIDPDAWLKNPTFNPKLGRVIQRLLNTADTYYRRSDIGISLLPKDCRLSIRAARLIYADIGRMVRKNGFDSVNTRAYTSKKRKLALIARALNAKSWKEHPNPDPARKAVQFLIDAIK